MNNPKKVKNQGPKPVWKPRLDGIHQGTYAYHPQHVFAEDAVAVYNALFGSGVGRPAISPEDVEQDLKKNFPSIEVVLRHHPGLEGNPLKKAYLGIHWNEQDVAVQTGRNEAIALVFPDA